MASASIETTIYDGMLTELLTICEAIPQYLGQLSDAQ